MEPSSAPWRILETAKPEPPGPEPGSRGLPWPAIGVALVAAAVAVVAILVTVRSEPTIGVDGAVSLDAGSVARGGTWSAGPASSPGDGAVVVDVGGAVARPGVYRLPRGSRVGDAIGAAGGYAKTADAAAVDRALNLAAAVRDGDKIRVPARGEPTGGPGAGGGASSGAGATPDARGGAGGPADPVDLNHATAEQLDALPGIGPATAAKIIAARTERPFSSVDDLGTRKVLGAATLAKLRSLVTTTP
jgi:competence protein ComEA